MSDQEEILAAEKAGANQCAVQVIYRLGVIENNPHQDGTDLHDAFHRGYQIESAMRGV